MANSAFTFLGASSLGITDRGLAYILISSVALWGLYGLSKYRPFRYLLILSSLLFSTLYMFWRATETVVWDTTVSIVASLLLLGAEFLGYIQQVIFYLLMSRGTDEKAVVFFDTDHCPTVDVMVTTYNEPVAVLRRTLAACTYLDYPQDKFKVYVCDDGDRPEVEALARQLGVHYIRRDDHAHAKAGNLNHAMTCTDGELIVTLDADMLPKSHFLQSTVGFFHKRRVAFVQAPQLFFNPDPFQHNLSSFNQVSNEQDFFMIEMESAKNQFNASMYVGSNCVFSRTALNDIGGFATGCITEDVATGMMLQAKGYRTYFVKQVLARGLSPESFAEMLHQRERWCRGNIQAFRKWNPVIFRGLTSVQRVLYASGALYWYFGAQKMIYILAPIVFLDFGIRTLQASVFTIVLFWLPQFLSSMLMFRRIAKGKRTTFWSHIYETAMAPSLAIAVVQETLQIKKLGFRVTNKGMTNDRVRIVWGAFLPHIVLLAGLMYGLGRQVHWLLIGQAVPAYYGIIDFWSLYNLVGILMSIYVSIELPRPRKSERFAMRVPVTLHAPTGQHKGQTVDLSEIGARIQLFESARMSMSGLELSIAGIEGRIPVAQIQSPRSDRFELRLVWDELPIDQYRQLVKLLYDQREDIMAQFANKRQAGIVATIYRTTRAHVKTLMSGRKRRVHVTDKQHDTLSS